MAHSGNPYRRARTGEPLRIPAQTYNEMLSVLSGGGSVISSRGASLSNDAAVHIRNDTGADRARYSVYGISGPVFLPDAADSGAQSAFEYGVFLSGVIPTASHAGAFAISIEPIRDGGAGLALLAGVTLARVEMVSESHQTADVKVGDPSRLLSGGGTAQLLWVQPAAQRGSQGFAWCVVRIGSSAFARRMGRVVGFFSGAFGVPNSGLRVRPINVDGSESDSDIDVFVVSYGDNASDYGRETLSRNADGTGGCFPSVLVNSRVFFSPAMYHGQVRYVADGWYQKRGC